VSDYDVVLLVEQPLSRQDATNLRGLHEEIEDPVRYHVLLPVEDASARHVSRSSRRSSAMSSSPTETAGVVRTSPVPRAPMADSTRAEASSTGSRTW
jgi:hypothetical protein